MALSLEADFLKLIKEGDEHRAAFLEALTLVRRFQTGDPGVWVDAARAVPRLEEVEARVRAVQAGESSPPEPGPVGP